MFDVAVLGAGPAGTSAAIWCASRGLRVVLVESSAFPRNRPGETLHPGIEPLLERLGVINEVHAAGFARHPGIYVAWNGRARFVPYGGDAKDPWMGFQAWRADFDDILIRRAVSLGVNILQPCVAKQPIVRRGRVAGIASTCGEIPARFVLDATGSASWLSGRLGIPRTTHSRRLIARYGYTRSPQRTVSRLPSLRRTENGWTWIARIQPDRYHWTTLSLKDVPDGPPAELARAELIGTIHSADVTWLESRCPAGDGYFLLGDAATRLDPVSSQGVLKALMSGIFAAHLISSIQRGLSERSAADAYTRWIREWFRHDARKLATYYRETGLDIAPLLAKGESPWGSSNLRLSNPGRASK